MDSGQDPHSRKMFPIADDVRGKLVDPRSVTFRHLMTHSSGLPPWRDVYRVAGPPPTPPAEPDPVTRHERWARAIEAMCQYPFADWPGVNVHYSDIGLMLLGEATARLNDTPAMVDVAITERVLAPLGLGLMFNPVRGGLPLEATIPTEDDPDWRGRRAWGEVHDENACGAGGGIAGHAGLFGAALDVATLGQAWLDNDSRLGVAFGLMDEARREQIRTGIERRGLGWALKATEDSSAGDLFSDATYGHTGFTGTSMWIDPQRRLVVACLTNRNYYGRLSEGIHPFRRALHDLMAKGLSA
jgi:CubicO group peptidase (beta-lactamase class C family)